MIDLAAGPDTRAKPGPARATAHAVLGVGQRRGPHRRLRSCVTSLRSRSPFTFRTAIAKELEPLVSAGDDFVRVCVAASSAGPIGGDQFRLDVHVQENSTLVLTEVSATGLLPGRDGAQSRTDVRIVVDSGATLVWWPEPVIAARACHHLNDVRIQLAADARLVMREELILGRHDEPAGRLQQRTRIERSARAAYIQDPHVGGTTGGTPAVYGSHRALGTVVVFDPAWDTQPPAARVLSEHAALMPLAEAGALISAIGADNAAVRAALRAGLETLGTPWDARRLTGPDPSGD